MASKQAYAQQQQGKLKEWRAQIDLLQAKAAQANAGVRIELNKQVEELHARRKAAEARLDELMQAGEEQWEGMKSGIDRALQEVGDRVKAAGSHFK
jgi:head-tail adaptor